MFAWIARRRLVRRLRSLQREHLLLLEQARDLQRNGDMRSFADRTAEAAVVEQRIDELERELNNAN